MKIALIHDYLNQYGGAERVLECFMDLFPDAPIYTLLSNLERMPRRFREAEIHNSFIHSIPFSKRHYKKLMPFFPTAIEQFDFRDYDVVLSSSSAFAKGIMTNSNQIHICYCHTPMRYVWDLYHQIINDDFGKSLYRFVLPSMLHKIRMWDQVSSHRVDAFIANSHNVSNRIRKYYGRPSTVIHPPVNFNRYFPSDEIEDYFLVVSRLIPYKRIDLVIEAFNELGWPLIIIGDGYDRDRLQKLAGSTIKFLGHQPDEVIDEYYAKCRAFIMAGEEDFGISPLEAQASGRPVIAYGKGGALETVKPNVTGLFFQQQNKKSLIQTLLSFQPDEFDPYIIRDHAKSFNAERFKLQINNEIKHIIDQKNQPASVFTKSGLSEPGRELIHK